VQTSNIRGAGTESSAWVALYGVDDSGGETCSGAHKLSSDAVVAMLNHLDSGEGRVGLQADEAERMREDLTSPQVCSTIMFVMAPTL
jgi:hypothetical protein